MSIFDEIKESYKKGSTLHKLIYINVGLFLVLHLIVIILVLANQVARGESGIRIVIDYLAIPADFQGLARRPWTVITYMFTHGYLYHILFNMLVFYWFGQIFIQEFGMKKLLGIYLLGGLAGAVLFLFSYNIFPYFNDLMQAARETGQSIPMTGASASVMAITVAVAVAVPNRRMNLVLLGPIKIVYIVLFVFIASTILDFTDNTGGKIAHIGGALLGYLFAVSYRKGKDFTLGFDRFMDNFSTLFKRREKMKVSYKRPADDFEYNKQKAEEQKDIDVILDKISKGGYDSLTKSEKETLFNAHK